MTHALISVGTGDTVSAALAPDRLRVRDIAGFILSAVAPLTVAAGVIPTAYAVTGLTGIPAAFAAVSVVLAVFAVGFVAMARRITNAGAFYAYAAQGLTRPVGVGTALVAVVAYNLLQLGLYGALGAGLHAYGAAHGVTAPWWLWSLGAWAVVAVLGQLWVDLNGRVLGVLLAAEIVVVLALTGFGLVHPAGGQLTGAGLSPQSFATSGVGAALVIAVLGFVGFENSAVYSEESRDPRRTVPVATYAALALMAVVYVGASWAMTVHAGPEHISAKAGDQGPELLFTLGPAGLAETARVLYLTSLFAAMLSFHNAVGRYMFSLGRESVLPRAFGRTNRRTGAPVVASAVQSLLGLVVIFTYAYQGWDPMVRLFFWLGTTGGYGVLLLLTITSAAVIGFFARHHIRETLWRRAIAPGLAFAALAMIVWLATRTYATLLGVPPDAVEARALPALFPAAFVVGLGYGWWLRWRRRDVYDGIGLGANAVTRRASTDRAGQTPAQAWRGGMWQ